MEELTKLNDELGLSGAKLYVAARKRGLDVSRAQAIEVAKGGATQLFKAPPRSSGKIASRAPRAKVQADIVDYKQLDPKENDGYKAALLASEVFSRKLYYEPLKSKRPEEVLQAYQSILARIGPIERLDTDAGGEWKLVEAKLKADGVGYVHRQGPNDLGVLDNAMGRWKADISRRMIEANSGKWTAFAKSATEAYNATPHAALRGDEPRESEKPIQRFHSYQDNARKIEQNQKVTEGKAARLEATGAFRYQLLKQSFTRSFKPRWSSEVLKVDNIQGSSVKATNGRTFSLNKVLPVDSGSKDYKVPATLAKGSAARDQNTKSELQPFEARLKAFLGNGSRTLTETSVYLKSLDGWEQALTKRRLNRHGGTAAALRLMSGFKIEGPAYNSKVSVVRRRIVGKRPS